MNASDNLITEARDHKAVKMNEIREEYINLITLVNFTSDNDLKAMMIRPLQDVENYVGILRIMDQASSNLKY